MLSQKTVIAKDAPIIVDNKSSQEKEDEELAQQLFKEAHEAAIRYKTAAKINAL